jgi:thiamine-monophosphate kinase
MAGVSRVAIAHGTALLGGDVSRSTGPFVIDVIALGHAEEPVRRSGAQPGDGIWVTGSLGGAACAVAAWTAGELPDPEARARFAHPLPRIEEARWLAQQGALHALIDLSDGLAGDAGHMAAASDVRIRLELARIPLHRAVHDAPARAAHGEVNIGSALRLALAGGEDYELCFAAPPSFGKSLVDAFQERFGIALTRVGSVEAGSGVVVVDKDGGTHALALTGYSHV